MEKVRKRRWEILSFLKRFLRGRPGLHRYLPCGSSPMESLKRSKTSEFWDKEAGTWELGRGIHWTEHLAIQERFNQKIGGHIHKDLFLYLADFLREKGLNLPVERALTLGCGAGEFERSLSKYNICLRHDGYDISTQSIDLAVEKAKAEGLTHLTYEVRDIDNISLLPTRYDVVFGIQSVHHFRELEHVFAEIRKALKPGGFFVLHEFIGPTRFQWSERQLELINGLLQLLPSKYRINRKDGVTLINKVWRPSIPEMESVDPSEAIRSGEIMDVLSNYFELIEIKELGGTVLLLLLEGIAGNFDYNKPEDMRFLKIFFEIEDLMMDIGEIPSDFAVIIARKQ